MATPAVVTTPAIVAAAVANAKPVIPAIPITPLVTPINFIKLELVVTIAIAVIVTTYYCLWAT